MIPLQEGESHFHNSNAEQQIHIYQGTVFHKNTFESDGVKTEEVMVGMSGGRHTAGSSAGCGSNVGATWRTQETVAASYSQRGT